MIVDPAIFYKDEDDASRLLRLYSAAEIASAAAEFLNRWEQREYLDEEAIEHCGLICGLSKCVSIDIAATKWVRASVSKPRFIIGCWFLYGYWRHVPRIDVGACEFVLSAVSSRKQDEDQYGAALLCLSALSRRADVAGLASVRGQTRAFLRKELRDADRKGGLRGIWATVEESIPVSDTL